jgi:hypothetical protein
MNEELTLLDKFGGTHLLMTFLIFGLAGFATVWLDQLVFTKLESAVGVTPTAF